MRRLIVAMTLFLSSVFAFAQYTGGGAAPVAGGYTGPSSAATTVEQVRNMWDDTPVILVGNIVQRLGSEKYLFRDATGEIMIEIDHKDWRGVTVGPDDLVEIQGEVDRDWNAIEVDVDLIRVVTKP